MVAFRPFRFAAARLCDLRTVRPLSMTAVRPLNLVAVHSFNRTSTGSVSLALVQIRSGSIDRCTLVPSAGWSLVRLLAVAASHLVDRSVGELVECSAFERFARSVLQLWACSAGGLFACSAGQRLDRSVWGCSLAQLDIRSTVQLAECPLVQLASCAIVQLTCCSLAQLYSGRFSSWAVYSISW